MNAILIDGKAVAQNIRDAVRRDVHALAHPPGLATVLVGEDPASAVYVATKRKLCVAAGIRDLHRHLPGSITQGELARVLDELSSDPDVTGILLQLPLPPHLDTHELLTHVDPGKDVDGLTETNTARLALGIPGLRPCTPTGIIDLLDASGVSLAGASSVIVGRSDLVGKPLSHMMLQRDATVTVCHSRTRNLTEVCRSAEVLVVAAGVPGLIGADAVAPGATVIDVGIHRHQGRLLGDVDFDAVSRVAGALTPVPGGVGPMTIAALLRNTVLAARQVTDRVPR